VTQLRAAIHPPSNFDRCRARMSSSFVRSRLLWKPRRRLDRLPAAKMAAKATAQKPKLRSARAVYQRNDRAEREAHRDEKRQDPAAPLGDRPRHVPHVLPDLEYFGSTLGCLTGCHSGRPIRRPGETCGQPAQRPHPVCRRRHRCLARSRSRLRLRPTQNQLAPTRRSPWLRQKRGSLNAQVTADGEGNVSQTCREG
jgi:hypothetical protein